MLILYTQAAGYPGSVAGLGTGESVPGAGGDVS